MSSAIGSFFTDVGHVAVGGLATAGMVFGVVVGAIGWPVMRALEWVSGGKITMHFGTYRHTILSSALGWGSMLAVLSPYVRTHYVGPVVNDAAREIGADARIGDVLKNTDDVVIAPITTGATMVTVSVPASWGLESDKEEVHNFAVGSLIAEPYSTGEVPVADVTPGVNGASDQLVVPPVTPGIVGALGAIR